MLQMDGDNDTDVVGSQAEGEPQMANAAAMQQDDAEQPGPVQMSDERSEMSQQVQEPEHGSVAAVLAQLSEPKVEAAPGQVHAEVLMAEQRVAAAQLAEGTDSSAVSQPEGLVIQLEEHEPTAEEDASQHIQLKQLPDLNAESEVRQAVQADNDVSNAVEDDYDGDVAGRPTEAAAE